MDKLNQYEAATLGKFIGDLLVLAHWLLRMALVSLLLWLASLVPLLSGPVIGLLLELSIWACISIAGFILAGNVLSYYYALGCERNNLERYSEQAKRKVGR